MKRKIIIIGGGVSGITTGLALQLLGFDTTIYTEHLVDENAPRDPRFASLYPAASIIPHSVNTGDMDRLLPASLSIFEFLCQQKMPSLEKHRHFEIFEFPKAPPEYINYLHNCSLIESSDRTTVPCRKNAPDLYGWVFDCLVAGWPVYMQQLYRLYGVAGGTIHQQKISRDSIENLPAEIIINCSGVWSKELFEDIAKHIVIRGHLMQIINKKPLFNSEKKIVSYNYTPEPSVYSTPDGLPSDVYFYPVNRRWILGGSRQRGTLSAEGRWQGKEHRNSISVSEVAVPKEILELNDNILQNSFGVGIEPVSKMKAAIGYRHTRENSCGGLRLEATEAYGKKIIHNYGHGGAGVTLSWGCALQVLKLLGREIAPDMSLTSDYSDPMLNNLQPKLQNVYLSKFTNHQKPEHL